MSKNQKTSSRKNSPLAYCCFYLEMKLLGDIMKEVLVHDVLFAAFVSGNFIKLIFYFNSYKWCYHIVMGRIKI